MYTLAYGVRKAYAIFTHDIKSSGTALVISYQVSKIERKSHIKDSRALIKTRLITGTHNMIYLGYQL